MDAADSLFHHYSGVAGSRHADEDDSLRRCCTDVAGSRRSDEDGIHLRYYTDVAGRGAVDAPQSAVLHRILLVGILLRRY